MRILMVGDIVGSGGQDMLLTYLPKIRNKFSPDVVVVNGENSAPNGRGIKRRTVQRFFEAKIDCITLGNHAWGQQEIYDSLHYYPALIRPANYPEGAPGNGYIHLKKGNESVLIVNLLGRTFMPAVDCPFRVINEILEETSASVVVVDFHAEATSEKLAFAHYVDGRVSAVIGTHTHVQTADNRVLPCGTAYMSDVGMTGPSDGVIGMDKEAVIKRFVTQLPARFEVAKGACILNAVMIDVDVSSRRAQLIERIHIGEDSPFFD